MITFMLLLIIVLSISTAVTGYYYIISYNKCNNYKNKQGSLLEKIEALELRVEQLLGSEEKKSEENLYDKYLKIIKNCRVWDSDTREVVFDKNGKIFAFVSYGLKGCSVSPCNSKGYSNKNNQEYSWEGFVEEFPEFNYLVPGYFDKKEDLKSEEKEEEPNASS